MTSVLLVGLGRWGANHLRTLRALPITLYCADTDPARLDAAVKSGIPAERCGRDVKAFLPKVECAVIATPAPSHFELTKLFLEAGKDVLVEKPLTVASAESKTLAELAAKTKRILQVGHIFLYDPASLWLRDAVAKGEFGRLKLLRGNFSGFKRPRTDGGVSFADAIHFAALFDFVLGAHPKRVTGHLADFLDRGMDDQSLIMLDYELPTGRVMAQIETGYHVPGKFRDVTVTGDKLSAACDFNIAQYKIKTFDVRHEPAKNGEVAAVEGATRQLEFPPSEPLLEETRAFLDCVATRKGPLADAWCGYWAVRVIEAAVESAKQGKTLVLEG
ncbi:MAG TPA: Gfo/Idh/MocA family oxidoreductase [Alphaproteobacteria bacterium]